MNLALEIDVLMNYKILTHVRCHMDDARVAVETGVDGLYVLPHEQALVRTDFLFNP